MKTAEYSVEVGTIIGDMYSRWVLDCVVELAYAVSSDVISRPQYYKSEDIPDVITDLRMSYGKHSNFADATQRQMMLMPIFGRSDGQKPDTTAASSPFHDARKTLVQACIAFAERAPDSVLAPLKKRVESALVPLRNHFQGLAGKSVQMSYAQIKAIFDVAVEILRSKGVAKVFGLDASQEGWPQDSDDPNGAQLIKAIGSMLKVPPECVFTHETKFILLQRAAREGRAALQEILSPSSDPDTNLETLVTKVYTWGTSLRDFQEAKW